MNFQMKKFYRNFIPLCLWLKTPFFWFDLVGCSIIEGSKTLGIIKDLHRYPLTDYFEIMTHSALVEKGLSNTFLIPYLERYIKQVDTQNKIVYTINCLDILESS